MWEYGTKNIKPQTELKSGHGFYEIWYLRPYYAVLIIKNIPSYFTHFDPKMNTIETTNIHTYTDINKTINLYFGYPNDNSELPTDNLFEHGKTNGIFFILNDSIHNC